MYAVIESGGKQYKVQEGDVLEVERLPETQPGATVTFDRVLLVAGRDGVKVGQPLVQGAKVTAELVDQVRGGRIRVFKMKRRKGFRKIRGHRQELSRVRIDKIAG